MTALTLQVATPYVSYAEYARLTGLPMNTIKSMVADGRLPTRKKNRPKDKPLINMVALTMEAAEAAQARAG